MIKIIAGEFKGRLLKTPKHARPILAQIKKSIFDILKPYLRDCLFLDLYAGSGAVGFEALSRGAKFCVFVEREKSSLKVISENLISLSCQQRCYIIRADILKDLFWIEKARNVIKERFNEVNFDLIFVGAPYVEKIYNEEKTALVLRNMSGPTLNFILNGNLLKKDGLLVVQHSKKEEVISDDFLLIRTQQYGDTIVSFFSAKK
ncbi:MAG: RsmD family RNA methyltransferase [Endomicrobia bacterium]|nr:RsmD family RNA methyltransferase [Endomicrobiia bacterium]